MLEGRRSRRHEDHYVELQVFCRLLCGHQVPVVDRVKGASHDAHTTGSPLFIRQCREIDAVEMQQP